MKGIYRANYKIDDFYDQMLRLELLALNKLGISYNVIYNEENEININIFYNINTLVNLNSFVLYIISRGIPKSGISYYSSQHSYSTLRMFPSIIFDLYEYILYVLKSNINQIN